MSLDLGLGGKRALVTGGTKGVGRAVVAALHANGMQVLTTARKAEQGLPGGVHFVAADVTTVEGCAAVSAAVRERMNGVDIIVHVAGGSSAPAGGFAALDEAQWQAELNLNLFPAVRLDRALLPAMIAQGSGKIVTVGALSALKGSADMGAYGVAKSAVLRLTEAMAAENGRHGINVNSVLPSIIDTPENRAAMPKADPSKWVSPQALADVIRFLASDAASAIQGALIPVTGRG